MNSYDKTPSKYENSKENDPKEPIDTNPSIMLESKIYSLLTQKLRQNFVYGPSGIGLNHMKYDLYPFLLAFKHNKNRHNWIYVVTTPGGDRQEVDRLHPRKPTI